MLPADIAQTIAAIHATPHRLVLAFAGAGSLSLAWLHAVAGSSRTVLEAVDAYAPTALAELVGQPIAHAVSMETAQAMAQWAYRRAQHLASNSEPLLGVGCTAAIATDRERRGQNRCIISVCSDNGHVDYELTMVKGEHDRLGEEELCSRLLIRAIAEACGAGIRE
jgi:hypothetical protein